MLLQTRLYPQHNGSKHGIGNEGVLIDEGKIPIPKVVRVEEDVSLYLLMQNSKHLA